ncbi:MULTISPECIES: VOC family protein [Cyanophyceae]|uniref:VOC family protein n=1 Tax=Cyanophyceae TaxID=3028117 RepID=UPI0023300D85|nr:MULTISPECIES: VOC family protein [Cyanophyceae]MDB9355943.1 VOC family protein [Nodularia spumigena CS-587/03]MDB9306527.1 VOC family protein [Nodularia spumigena CS-591/12]MDB9320271.1 VOC family protein [Nodularia spumigena CS-590/01A]MDB9323319.1 VOC family protein [Nodularia spumigena CS-591/07A]MDB9325635.1 VOC family protein [Nodularia spumigena CS-590/02]
MTIYQGKLNHIEIYVSNLEKTCSFWGWFLELLGYSVFQEWSEGKSWKLDDTYIVFVQVEAKFLDYSYHRCRVGLNHLAFYAKSREQVDEVTQKVKEKGLTILYLDRHPYAGGNGHYALYFEDPDRIKVELVAPD